MPISASEPLPDSRAAAAGTGKAASKSSGEPDLLQRLNCPACRSDEALIVEVTPNLRCAGCNTRFPLIDCGAATIPWLFRSPEAAQIDWSARFQGFLNQNINQYNRLNRALDKNLSSESTRERIEASMRARREHRNHVSSLLTPLSLDGDIIVPAITKTLRDRLPKNQGLTSYADNVFRDWAWYNGENEALFDAIEAVVSADKRDAIGSVLTLGAGAGRLSYDIHQRYSPEQSVALDFNPLLLLLGCRVMHGEVVPLYEFPIAAIDEAMSGVLQHCQAPKALDADAASRFSFVLGDATNPPFAAQSFDTVVTPWLIDIIPQDFKDFVPQVNRLLPDGGVWLNTGSLAFLHENPRRCYSEREVLEIVEQNGFEIVTIDHRSVPYLQSPHSAHGRVERIVSFIARKVANVDCPTDTVRLPGWLLDVTRPVPGSDELVVESSSYLFAAQVTAAIDGKRSIKAIARMVAREYDLDMEQCVHAVSRILIDAWEGGGSASPPW